MPHLSTTPLRTLLTVCALAGLGATTQGAHAAPGQATNVGSGSTPGRATDVGSSPKATAKVSAKKAKRTGVADLVVRSLEVEFIGESVAVDADVVNAGTKRARRNDTVVALSTDPYLGDDDELLDEQSLGRFKPGRIRDFHAEVELPADEDLPAGEDLYLVVCADAGEIVREKSEGNNCASELIAEADTDASGDEGSGDEPADGGDDAVTVEDE